MINIQIFDEIYILYFASDEMVYSEKQKINQSFTGTYSDIVNVVLKIRMIYKLIVTYHYS